ncbi:ATP-binding cassette domain-containing protein [Ruicaihuangia caeni]|uniref:ATP-binding cassette domain-containing protein n=1 Tax=Ruicaihuangia caeni TaxID=3042517 RepID=A0AAW6T820_9MICO|nr:ATP-binding cassette domain-containing protein [Klugiella sp. YN-L-19]MDI2098488.1 ATP-binding cassette domain-containing protein [Klugiella sp. YN-L-19]
MNVDRVLTLQGVSMRFGAFTALENVDVRFEPGLVHAVVGQNGAGKTTFSRVVTGIYTPSEGRVLLGGAPLRAGSVTEARRQGVDMVHQHFSSPPSMTIAETLEFFSSERRSFFSRRGLVREWQRRVDALGFDLDVSRRIRDLSVPERQSVEIVRALSGEARVIIFDEPTASMPAQAVDALLGRIRDLAAEGLTVIVVLHKLSEVFAVADTVTVLNRGIVTLPKTSIAEVTADEVTRHIIGDTGPAGSAPGDVDSGLEGDAVAVAAGDAARRGDAAPAEEARPASGEGVRTAILDVRGLSTVASPSDARLHEVDLVVDPGEIVGVAGVEGNGQLSLVEALVGIRDATGSIELDGVEVSKLGVVERRRHGLRVIPFERNVEGVSSTSAVWENHALGEVLRSPRRLLAVQKLRAAARRRLDAWGVSYRGLDQNAGELSGGNVQRLILARELDDEARLIIAAQPTRGLDVGAIAFVQRSLAELADRGNGVLLISTDLEELKGLADRIVVLRGGRHVAELPPSADLHEIGRAMLGGDGGTDSVAAPSGTETLGAQDA